MEFGMAKLECVTAEKFYIQLKKSIRKKLNKKN